MKIPVFGAGVPGCNLARGSWAEEIQKNGLADQRQILTPDVLLFVYAVNGARGFLAGFWQLLVILSVMNLIDRFLVDGFWVGHTKAWTIPGTEDLKPYITAKDTCREWVFGTVGMAVISAALSGIMALFLR